MSFCWNHQCHKKKKNVKKLGLNLKYPFVIFCKNPEVHSPPSCYLSSPSSFFFYLSCPPRFSRSISISLLFLVLLLLSSISLILPRSLPPPPSSPPPFSSPHFFPTSLLPHPAFPLPLNPAFPLFPPPHLPPDSPPFPVRRVPPRFSILPSNHEIMPGGSVNITCVAVGSPMPYVKWMLGNEDLTPEDEMPIGRNVLELNGVRESANYTCVAMSSLGIIEATAQVLVKSKSRSNCRINHSGCWR